MSEKNQAWIQEITQEHHPVISEVWDSCMNMEKIPELGKKPLEKDLKQISDATNPFHKIEINVDLEQVKTHALYVRVPDTTLPMELFYFGQYARWISSDYMMN